MYRPHHGLPANPEVTSDRCHRMRVLADPPARLSAGPLGQHRPRADRRRPLGPGPYAAGQLTTAPEALAPQEHHRPAADRQVAHPHFAAAVWGGRYAAARTADHRGRGLDGELPLVIYQLRQDDLEAVQAEQRRHGRTTVLTHLGPPSCWTSDIRKICEAPGAVWSPTAPSAAPHHAS